MTVYESKVDFFVVKRDEFISGYSTNYFNNYFLTEKLGIQITFRGKLILFIMAK